MIRSCLKAIGLLVATSVVFSCSGTDPGWTDLWQRQWTWHHVDRNWVRGVRADGRVIRVAANDLRFRTELLNSDDVAAELELSNGSTRLHWTLEAGERRTIDVALGPGDHMVRASPEMILGSPRLGRPLRDRRLLVFVLVDTLRDDHVTSALTPRILRELEGGRRWLQATANCSWTLPSVASLFTARPTLELTSPAGDLIGIPDGIPTWASQLEASGFTGGAVVANYTVHTLNGFAHGFASFNVPDAHEPSGHPDAAWVVEEAERWLAAHHGEDAFLYLHLMDPHQPYRSHSDPSRAIPDLEPLAMRRRTATADEASSLRRSYADEVHHVDDILAPLLAGLPPNAVVVFTSDHGEALGEHQAWGHGLNLYQESLRVPLIIRGPKVPAGEVDHPVQLMDLGPTVLNLMGVPTADAMIGRSILSREPKGPIISTTFGGGPLRWAWRDKARKVTLRMAPQGNLGARARSAMREGAPLPNGGFFFDLEIDPGESSAGPVPAHILDEIGGAFAATAGRMVPGLQLLVWNTRGAVVRSIEIPGRVEVVQAWSGAAVSVRRDGDVLTLECEDAYPLCAVAADVEPTPESARTSDRDGSWIGVAAGEWFPLPTLTSPASVDTGTHLWWNPDRPLVVGGHEETLERLRALGYIE